MKLINLKDFNECPAGAVFSQYTPFAFGPLYIKGHSPLTSEQPCFYAHHLSDGIAFTSREDIETRLTEALQDGNSVDMSFDMECWHACDADAWFAVWEAKDIVALVNWIAGDLTDTMKRQHALLKRAKAALDAWHKNYGIISALYVPPGGDVDLIKDIAEELKG